jgi:hypothetical protein
VDLRIPMALAMSATHLLCSYLLIRCKVVYNSRENEMPDCT